MDHLQQFLAVAMAYKEGHGLTINQASDRLFQNPRRLSYLKRSRNAEELDPRQSSVLIEIMHRNWPSGAEWPETVNRPPR